jgi:hypothetical protein
MITRIHGLVSDVIAHHFDNLCFIIFKKRRQGKPYELAITAKRKDVSELNIHRHVSVYTECVIKSRINFGKVYTEVFAERISLKQFEENPDYVKPQRIKRKDESEEPDIFSESENEQGED